MSKRSPTTFESAGARVEPTSELEPFAFVGDDGRPLRLAEEDPPEIDADRLRERIARVDHGTFNVSRR